MKKTNEPPVVKLFKSEPLQAKYGDGTGDFWNVARLIDDTKDLKPFNCPLACLNLSSQIWQDSNIEGLAVHCKQVNDADLSKPIILDWNGEIADGRHRVIKALMKGKRTIKAVRMQWKPSPCNKENE